MLAIAIFAVIALVILLAVIAYNRLVRSRIRVPEARSGIDVQLRRRGSLSPNLVETASAYATHERETFEEVTQARSPLQQDQLAADPIKYLDCPKTSG